MIGVAQFVVLLLLSARICDGSYLVKWRRTALPEPRSS